MLVSNCRSVCFSCQLSRVIVIKVKNAEVGVPWTCEFLGGRVAVVRSRHRCSVLKAMETQPENARIFCSRNRHAANVEQKTIANKGKKEHHLWIKKDAARSGQKARSLKSCTPLYGALDKWIAWEPEFPLIAAAKALRTLRKRSQWLGAIQVAKWMLSKGQGITLATYDTLLLAFDMDKRVDEAESLWNMILHAHTCSIPKQLFSRMISLYDHHDMPEVPRSWDMEELGVGPDDDTARRVACISEAWTRRLAEARTKEVTR